MGCASGIAKYVLFLFNLICALAGLALLIVGVLFQLNISDFTDAVPEDYAVLETLPILLIVLGSVVFIIAFFGCCGAVRESTCMLTSYAVILLLLLVLQVAFGVVAFLQIKDQDDFQVKIGEEFKNMMRKYTDPHWAKAVDGIQQTFQCCGANGPADWALLGTVWPKSCCEDPNQTCIIPFANGCTSAIFDKGTQLAKVIGIIVISVAAVELVGAIFALCLSSSIKNSYRRGAYA